MHTGYRAGQSRPSCRPFLVQETQTTHSLTYSLTVNLFWDLTFLREVDSFLRELLTSTTECPLTFPDPSLKRKARES